MTNMMTNTAIDLTLRICAATNAHVVDQYLLVADACTKTLIALFISVDIVSFYSCGK